MCLLEGKVALITGAGSGMGKASTKVFVRDAATAVRRCPSMAPGLPRALEALSKSTHNPREAVPTPDGGLVEQRVVDVDVPLGEAVEDLVERDPPLEARERGAEAEVDPVPEREVMPHPPADVELVAIRRERAMVAVCRAGEEHDGAARRNRLAVVLDVPRHGAADLDGRPLVAQDLLDRVRQQVAVVAQSTPLVGVLGQELPGPADQAVRRLVARGGEDVHEDEDLVAR